MDRDKVLELAAEYYLPHSLDENLIHLENINREIERHDLDNEMLKEHRAAVRFVIKAGWSKVDILQPSSPGVA